MHTITPEAIQECTRAHCVKSPAVPMLTTAYAEHVRELCPPLGMTPGGKIVRLCTCIFCAYMILAGKCR